MPTQHREQQNQHVGADIGNSGSDAASWASCTIAEMPLDHRLYPFRPPIPLWTYLHRTLRQSFVALAEALPMAAYPSSHFATDRTAHGFRGGMSYAKR